MSNTNEKMVEEEARKFVKELKSKGFDSIQILCTKVDAETKRTAIFSIGSGDAVARIGLCKIVSEADPSENFNSI